MVLEVERVDAAWLDDRMERHHVTNRELAEHLGVDSSAVSRMRGNGGGRKISSEEAHRIRSYFSKTEESGDDEVSPTLPPQRLRPGVPLSALSAGAAASFEDHDQDYVLLTVETEVLGETGFLLTWSQLLQLQADLEDCRSVIGAQRQDRMREKA